jgi:hypothetical protein
LQGDAQGEVGHGWLGWKDGEWKQLTEVKRLRQKDLAERP